MASNPSRRPAVPSAKATPDEVKKFLDSVLDYASAYRIRIFRKLERARLYRGGDQWIEPDFTGYADPLMTPFWKPMEFDASNWQPTPVQNEIFPAISHETARLVSVGADPYVRPDAPEPKYERAAKTGRNVLRDRMEKLQWRETEYAGTLNMPLFGTGIWKSGWEIDRRKTVALPVDTAVKCPECGFRLASPTIPPGKMIGLQGKGLGDRLDIRAIPPKEPGDQGALFAKATNCLECDGMGGAGAGSDSMAAAEPVLSAAMGATMGTPPAVIPEEPDADTEAESLEAPGDDTEAPTAADDLTPSPGGAADDAGFAPTDQSIAQPPPTPGPPALVPYTPSDTEAARARDMFGRRLGEDIPLGDTYLKAVSPYDFFPQNQGLETTSQMCEEFGESHVENLDWITACYENGYQVKPEGVTDIWKWHPIVGGTNVYFGGGATADPRLFDNHARIKEWHKAPWFERDPQNPDAKPKLNRGRSLVMANGVVLLNGDFMMESRTHPGELIPRVIYEAVQWELAPKEMFGIGMVELTAPIQDTINTRRSQVIDARHRFGSPKLLAEEGMDLTFAGFTDTGYNSDIWYYRPTPEGGKPEAFGNTQMGGEWTQEEDRDVAALQRISGVTDADTGNLDLSKSGWPASAIMFAAEQSAKGRENRIERIRQAKRRLFSHQFALIHEFYREKRYYSIRAKNNRWDVKSFIGADLMGQCDVQLYPEPSYNVKMFRRQAIKDGIDAGLIDTSTDVAKRRAKDELDIPQDIDEEKNLQVERAEEEWIAFTEDPTYAPVVHQITDSNIIHYQQHSLDWMGEEAGRMKEAVKWNDVELALWGWEEQFDMLEAQEAAFKAAPPPAQPPTAMPQQTQDPTTGAVIQGTALRGEQEALTAKWQADTRAWQMIQSLPKPLELRLTLVWGNMLKASGTLNIPGSMMPDTGRAQKLSPLLRWYAHLVAHYRLAKQQASAATAGATTPAPPGAPETPGGMMPSTGAYTVPGAGAGPTSTTSAGTGAAA